MPRQGRKLETLVRDLEVFLARAPVTVKSPDYLPGRLSGARREVDVSISGIVGSTTILAIIECRQRRTRPDVTWIEQISTKKNDVAAHHAIAVSSKPFTSAARTLAANLGIELRTFAEVDKSLVLGWATPLFSDIPNFRIENSNLRIGMRRSGALPLAESRAIATECVFESGVARRVCAGGGAASMGMAWSDSDGIRRI
jgi:hypothetical protein